MHGPDFSKWRSLAAPCSTNETLTVCCCPNLSVAAHALGSLSMLPLSTQLQHARTEAVCSTSARGRRAPHALVQQLPCLALNGRPCPLLAGRTLVSVALKTQPDRRIILARSSSTESDWGPPNPTPQVRTCPSLCLTCLGGGRLALWALSSASGVWPSLLSRSGTHRFCTHGSLLPFLLQLNDPVSLACQKAAAVFSFIVANLADMLQSVAVRGAPRPAVSVCASRTWGR